MESHGIGYSETGSFSPAVISYLDGDERLLPFFSQPPTLEGFRKLIASRKQPANRALLADVLQSQYAGTEASEQVTASLALLKNEHTFTVTTGHQLNIFTGPLYFIYKIVTAIHLARQLAGEFPGRHFIPVYWMASEDHDFAEINHLTVAGNQLTWKTEVAGATGRISTDSIKEVLGEYIRLLGPGENAAQLAALVDRAYTGQRTLAGATRVLVDGLFGKYGLLVIDADDKRLKEQFAPVIERELLERNSNREILETSNALRSAGFKTQVNPREVNFFYLKDGFRERIVVENNHYEVLNSSVTFTAEEIREEIHAHPERFSPNVMLRPLYQETILPNIAYIGGGAELVYWLQLKRVFDFYAVDFPGLVLRNSALIIDQPLNRVIRGLGLAPADLFMPADDLKKKWIVNHSGHDLSVNPERGAINAAFQTLKHRVTAIGPTLGPSTMAIQARLEHALANLEKKLVKAEKQKFTKEMQALDELKTALFPGGELQERSENFGPLYSAAGGEFIEELLRHFQPLEFKFTILADD